MRIFALAVTIVAILSATVLINGCDEEMQIVGPVINNIEPPPIEDSEIPEDSENPGVDIPVDDTTEDQATSEPVDHADIPEEPDGTKEPQTVMIPDSVFIPPANTVLSKNEQDLKDFFALTDRNPTKPNLQTGKPADRISSLPLKDREEVYDALIAAVDLPFFAEAAEKMKERNIAFASLFIEAVKTKDWEKFDSFLQELDEKIGIRPGEVDEAVLVGIYFEENPGDKPLGKECSCYWMLLEYYRIQLEHPHLTISVKKDREHILQLYRQSAKLGNVLGLANPWN